MTRAGCIRTFVAIGLTLGLAACGGGPTDGVALPDGMVGYPVPTDPTVTFEVWFQVGSQNDPPGKEGLAYLTAEMISEGATKQRTLDEILEALYPMAAGYGVTVDREMTVLSGRTHKDNLDAYFELYTQALLEPRFSQEDFDRVRTDALNYLEKQLRYASDEELGKAALFEFVYEGTPYAHPSVGTVEGLKAISLDDVRAFYARWYGKGNAVAAVGGGYDSALANAFQDALAGLPDGDRRLRRPSRPPRSKAAK